MQIILLRDDDRKTKLHNIDEPVPQRKSRERGWGGGDSYLEMRAYDPCLGSVR